MELTREEKKTIISFSEEPGGMADIETFNGKIKRDILKAKKKYPYDVDIIDNGDGSISAIFPKKWIKVRAPRIRADEQRAEIAERLRFKW